MSTSANAGQIEFWNGEVGRLWSDQVEDRETLTAEVTAILSRLVNRGDRILEIGCGGGGLSLALAAAAGVSGEVLAVDVSVPLLDRARQRATAAGLNNLQFRLVDAQDAELPPAHFDLLVSQFGVMFFADTTGAFANLRRSLRSGGLARFAVWGPIDRNPFFGIPRAAAVAQLGPPSVPPGQGPGPFGLSNPEQARLHLVNAGFLDAASAAVDVTLSVAGDATATGEALLHTGPAAALLRQKDGTDADRRAIAARIVEGFRRYETPKGLQVPATILMLSGRAP